MFVHYPLTEMTTKKKFCSFSPKINSDAGAVSCSQKQRNQNNETQIGCSHNHNRLSWPQFRIVSSSGSQQTEFSTIREAPPLSLCGSINLDTDAIQHQRDSLNRHQGALERVLCPDEAKVLERANQIVMYVTVVAAEVEAAWGCR